MWKEMYVSSFTVKINDYILASCKKIFNDSSRKDYFGIGYSTQC